MEWIDLIMHKLGLVLNLVGTLLIAFSFGKNIADAYQTYKRKRKVYLASLLHPLLFKMGLIFVIAGFLFNIIFSEPKIGDILGLF